MWQFSATGKYSTKSAYEALFIQATQFRPWERIWKSWAPGKCKFFMWTAAAKRCWTADLLARKGLPHPSAHFVTRQMKQLTTYQSHVLTRQVWSTILQKVGLQTLAPQIDDLSFDDWWAGASGRVDGQVRMD